MIVALLALIIISIGIVGYGHTAYTKENTLSITHVVPIVTVSNGTYTINAINLSIANNGDSYENVSFLYTFNRANNGNYILSSELPGIAPHGVQNYTISFVIKKVTNNSDIYVMAFSKDYITSQQLNLTKISSGR